jgi:predicted SAM-dependent methyltransferase/tetratricopeptide (TPR) repeat protein
MKSSLIKSFHQKILPQVTAFNRIARYPESASNVLKFMQVHTFYPSYLQAFYAANSDLKTASFDDQIAALIRDGFSANHMMAPYMGSLGYDTCLVIANNHQSQIQWLREQQQTLDTTDGWLHEITRYQIEAVRPDILYLSDPITFTGHFLRTLNHRPRLVLGWRAAVIPDGIDWSGFDVMLSGLENLRRMALKLGARSSEYFFPGYPAWINSRIPNHPKQYDVVFSGQWNTTLHAQRNHYLTQIAKAAASTETPFSLALYLSGQSDTFTPEAAKYHLGERYGLEMYRALASGRIVIDARAMHFATDPANGGLVDLCGRQTSNMRIFEATGCGTFLLAEHQDNLKDYFQIGVEIETFTNDEDLIEKIYYYLANPDEREAIAQRGHNRCLTEYSMEQRAVELDRIILKNLETANRSSRMRWNLRNLANFKNPKQQAVNLIESGDYEGAFKILCQLKASDSPIEDVDYLRAICFFRINQILGAREALKEELRLFPHNVQAIAFLKQINRSIEDANAESLSSVTQDEEFNEVLKIIKPYTMLSEKRLYSLFYLAKDVCIKNISGHFVECGVAAGGSSALIAYVIKHYSKTLRQIFCFDTFQGMPAPTAADMAGNQTANATGWGAGTCRASENSLLEICDRLGVIPIVRPVKGLFSETLPQWRKAIGNIAFLHMDGDWYQSTLDILENLYDQILPKCSIQIDDYGHWQGCKKAIHEFEARKNLKFDLNWIDDTGVWFQKADHINHIFQSVTIDKRLLNLGCGRRYHADWINVDFNSASPNVIAYDLIQGIPFESNSFDAVYHSHILEHFSKSQAPEFIRECFRILKPQGIIRIAVPDLEKIAKLYLSLLDKALEGDPDASDRYEWIVLELFDQMVRTQSGGEMLKYWYRNPMPAESFVLERMGPEVNDFIQRIRSSGSALPEHGSLSFPDAQQIARFRFSGEVHQWMYDRFSLGKLLKDAGFVDINVCNADESLIPNFNSYHLDLESDGMVRKPDSLFMEAIKHACT